MGKCLQRALNPHLRDNPQEEGNKNPIRMPSTSNCKLKSSTYSSRINLRFDFSQLWSQNRLV